MIAQLVRQDPAFRRLPFWVLMALVWATAATGVIAWITARHGPVDLELLALLIWFSVALYLVFGEISTRTNSFNLSLPISARELWLSHLIAVGLTGIAVLAISAGVTIATLFLIGKLIEGWQIDAESLAVLGGLLLAGLILAVGIVHAFRPDAQNVPLSFRRVGWSLMAAVVPLVLAFMLRPLGTFGVVIVFGLAAAMFAYVFRAIPETLSAPTETRRASAPIEATEPVSWSKTERHAGVWLSLRVVHGVTTFAKKPVAIWLVMPFLLFLGFWVSGIDARASSNTQRFAYPFMIVYVMMALTTMPLHGLGVIDWLPWSRRRTLALITLPFFLCVATGYGIGHVTNAILGDGTGDKELLCFVKDRESGESRFCRLPSTFEIAWDGKVPEITTSSGEVHTLWSKPVVKRLPIRMYYPYDVPPGSSIDFTALQISRAAAAVYNTDIPPDEIRTRYLEMDGSTPALTLQADYPALRQAGHALYFPGIMAMVVVLWSLLTAAYIHWLRGGVSEEKRKIMGVVFIAIPMLLWIFDFVLEATELSEIAIRNAFINNLARSAGETPAGVVAVWVGSALLAWGAYRLVERRFERAELSMKPIGRHG